MLGHAGAYFVGRFDLDVGDFAFHLAQSLQGSELAGDFCFFRYEVDEVVNVNDVAGGKDAGHARFTVLVDDGAARQRMHGEA